MASYEALTFSPSVFHEKVLAMCDRALEDAVLVILGNEYFYNGTIQMLSDYEGFDGYAEVTAGDLKAWIVEYGQGAKAEFWRNPYWEDYVRNSGLTNRWRLTDPRVRNRGAGSRQTVNFDENSIRTFTGKNPEGRLLDEETQDEYSVEAEPFLQELLQEAYQAFEGSLSSQMQSFDISSCFVKSQINV